MRYVIARYKDYQSTMAYRIYVCDGLYAQGQDQMLTTTFTEYLQRLKQPVNNKTGDEVAAEVISKCDLKVKIDGECI